MTSSQHLPPQQHYTTIPVRLRKGTSQLDGMCVFLPGSDTFKVLIVASRATKRIGLGTAVIAGRVIDRRQLDAMARGRNTCMLDGWTVNRRYS
ncbi:MAG: hypothetical protein A2Y38_11670 [Spirochaetes bacterium GWB1_59_5]|nr:MAG: hypothetical protein A2Y38_11670 [Spirochaetes bacterium GWB1_59_5]